MPPIIGYVTVINVMDYGATGLGTSDDTTAIQRALNAVPAATANTPSGAIVYFPQGTYLISSPLTRTKSNTHILGEGKDATIIRLNVGFWTPSASPLNPSLSFMLDLGGATITDCSVRDLTIDGRASALTVTGNSSQGYCGILAGIRSEITRVNIYDVWGYGIWIFGSNAEWVRVIDCEADLGSNPRAIGYVDGNDCIGGGGMRSLIQRFHWMGTMTKNTALDFQAGGGPNAEVSVDIIDCINESARHVALEGAVQSSIRGCRFYLNQLKVKTNTGGNYVINPRDILVEGCIFIGPSGTESGLVVHFDGGNYAAEVQTVQGGRVAVIGNTFIDCDASAIEWAGDDESTSLGGSRVGNNRIFNPNQTGGSEAVVVEGIFAPLGSRWGSGISVLTTYGLTIQGNTIVDASGDMVYSMQLSTPGTITDHNTTRILVQGNLCGSSPGVGNGSAGTFYYSDNPTADNPSPILLNNTNQPQGLDSTVAGAVYNGVSWPGPGGYPYNALICVALAGGTVNYIQIGSGGFTGLSEGSFYVPAGQTFLISWNNPAPTINVFQS